MNRPQGRHPNFELCDVLIRLKDGSLSTADIEYQPKLPWREGSYPLNAAPGRMKICMFCMQSLPIADFLEEGGLVRTVIRGEAAFVVADVRQWCIGCQEDSDHVEQLVKGQHA